MYRDDTAASRARLVLLERELRTARSARATFERYRRALRDELARLRHAIVWYENGERFGFNRLRTRDDLSPSRKGDLRRQDDLEAHVQAMSKELVAGRTAEILRELARRQPSDGGLSNEVQALEDECAALRIEVEAFARQYPEHPPPPEYRASPRLVLLLIGITFAALAAPWFLLVASL